MGSAASKPARSAAGAAARQYPKKPAPPPRTPVTSAPKATPTPPPASQTSKTEPAPAASRQPVKPSSQSQGPTYHSKEPPSNVRSAAIDLDSIDPDFAASLRKIGPVDPSTNYEPPHVRDRGSVQTVFPTSSNPALLVIKAREQVTKAAQEENARMGLQGFSGRQFLDSLTIHQALTMREKQRLPSSEIDRLLQLKKGTFDKFGKSGVVSSAA